MSERDPTESYTRSVAARYQMRKCRQILVGRSVFLTWPSAQAGFDDALLTGPDGVISEGAITNIGFFDGNTVLWPSAPSLAGITMQLVAGALAERGIPSRSDTSFSARIRSSAGTWPKRTNPCPATRSDRLVRAATLRARGRPPGPARGRTGRR